MASSECPHSPLATPAETVYRAVSMYMLAQYFIVQENNAPDLTLNGLSSIYANLQIVNKGMTNRLRIANTEDSTVKEIPYSIEESLEELEDLFHAYKVPQI